jgi:hypothetical protein
VGPLQFREYPLEKGSFFGMINGNRGNIVTTGKAVLRFKQQNISAGLRYCLQIFSIE